MHPFRRLVAVAVSCTIAAVCLGLTAAPANADDGYTYWGYYQQTDSGWKFSMKGAGEVEPPDGSVDGWRFATTVTNQERPPRTDLTFDEICADTEAGSDEKRVGVVLDYGTSEDAPDGSEVPQHEALCAVVPADATGQQVLQQVGDVRSQGGLNCAINGYPASGCGTPVTDVTPPTTEEDVDFAVPAAEEAETESAAGGAPTEDGLPLGLIGVGVLVLVLVLAGVLVARRRA